MYSSNLHLRSISLNHSRTYPYRSHSRVRFQSWYKRNLLLVFTYHVLLGLVRWEANDPSLRRKVISLMIPAGVSMYRELCSTIITFNIACLFISVLTCNTSSHEDLIFSNTKWYKCVRQVRDSSRYAVHSWDSSKVLIEIHDMLGTLKGFVRTYSKQT